MAMTNEGLFSGDSGDAAVCEGQVQEVMGWRAAWIKSRRFGAR